MKTKIFKFVVGAIATMAIAAGVGYYSYLQAKDKYFRELKETIDEKHLEGKNEIGAYCQERIKYAPDKEMELFDKSMYDEKENVLAYLFVSANFWNSAMFGNNYKAMINSGKYRWYNFRINSNPFIIILKKTDRGYDLIGEFIQGIGVSDYYPEYLKNKVNEDGFTIKPDLIYNYVNYLYNEKYPSISITRDTKDLKFNMLEDLLTDIICTEDESLNFRTNKYYELKYDNYYAEIGSSPIVSSFDTFGNYANTLFVLTATFHYSIQENEGVLEKEYIEYTLIAMVIVLAIYSLLFILYNHLKTKGNEK